MKLKTHSNKNFSKINRFLKNNILFYLPMNQRLNNMSKFKKMKEALDKQKNIKMLKENFDESISYVDFNMIKMRSFIEKLKINDKIIEDFSIYFFEDICDYLLQLKYKNTSSLKLKNYNFTEDLENMRLLYNFLMFNKSIKKLSLSKNKLGENIECFTIFCTGMEKCINIEELNLNENNLGLNSDSLKVLCLTLEKCKNLKILKMSSNILGLNNSALKILTDFLKNNRTLKEINLKGNHFGAILQNIKCLAEVIRENKSIEKFNISSNDLGIRRVLLSNYPEIINILGVTNEAAENIIITIADFKSIYYLSEVIPFNNTIEEIDLSNNHLGRNDLNYCLIELFFNFCKNLKLINLEGNGYDERKSFMKRNIFKFEDLVRILSFIFFFFALIFNIKKKYFG